MAFTLAYQTNTQGRGVWGTGEEERSEGGSWRVAMRGQGSLSHAKKVHAGLLGPQLRLLQLSVPAAAVQATAWEGRTTPTHPPTHPRTR